MADDILYPIKYDCNKKITKDILDKLEVNDNVPACFIDLMALDENQKFNVSIFRSRWDEENKKDTNKKCRSEVKQLLAGNNDNSTDEREKRYKDIAVASSWLLNNYFCIPNPNTPLLVEPGSPTYGWSDTTEDLFNFFSDLDVYGVGNKYISSYCFYLHDNTNFKNKIMYLNKVYDNWCGCFSAPDVPTDNKQKITSVCNYACTNGQDFNENPIQLFYFDKYYTYIPEDQIEKNDELPRGADLAQIKCQLLICVIDIGIINILYSKGITVNFNQICNTCTSKNEACYCIIDVTNSGAVEKTPGFQDRDQVKFNLDCGQYVCVKHMSGNKYREIDCTKDNLAASALADYGLTFGFLDGESIGNTIKSKEWSLLIFIFIFLIAFFIFPGIYSLFKINIKIRQEKHK